MVDTCLEKVINTIRAFIAVDENQDEIHFEFTDAAVDILKGSYIILDEEVAEEIKNAVMSNDRNLFPNPKSVSNLIKDIESQVFCEQFLKNAFPKMNISYHEIVSESNKITVKTTCNHCNDICTRCIEVVK